VNSTDFLNEYMYPQNSNNNVKEYNQRTTPSSNPIKRTVASHTNDDALTKLSGSINRDYVYNDDGDLTSMTNCFGTTNYEYDVFGNLKKVTLTDGKIIEYKVDGLNRRIKKLVNGTAVEYYLWYDQTHIAAILDGNKIIKIKYIYGPESQISPSYVVKDGVTYKVLHDPGLGSIRYVIDPSTQQVMQEVEYDENGNIMKNTNPDFQPILFSGGLYDFDTKLTRFGARDYDPTIGRWTTKDPIGFAGGDTNLYAYVGGNPMSYNDPSGLKSTVYLYPGAGGFNHIGISVGNQPSIGNYPGGFFYDQIDQGKTPIQSVTLNTTSEQDAAIQRSLNQGQGYGLVTNNCAQTVNQALCDGGAVCAPRYSPTTIFPNNYINFLGGK
jgi:RHS repeat-associated protein